jgi:hypothetical protein
VQYPNFYVESEGKPFWQQLKKLKELAHLDQISEEKYAEKQFVFALKDSGFSNIDFSQLPEYKVV